MAIHTDCTCKVVKQVAGAADAVSECRNVVVPHAWNARVQSIS